MLLCNKNSRVTGKSNKSLIYSGFHFFYSNKNNVLTHHLIQSKTERAFACEYHHAYIQSNQIKVTLESILLRISTNKLRSRVYRCCFQLSNNTSPRAHSILFRKQEWPPVSGFHIGKCGCQWQPAILIELKMKDNTRIVERPYDSRKQRFEKFYFHMYKDVKYSFTIYQNSIYVLSKETNMVVYLYLYNIIFVIKVY